MLFRSDVDLARRINRLLNEEGFTIKGAQKALTGGKAQPVAAGNGKAPEPMTPAAADQDLIGRLEAIRAKLAAAIAG